MELLELVHRRFAPDRPEPVLAPKGGDPRFPGDAGAGKHDRVRGCLKHAGGPLDKCDVEDGLHVLIVSAGDRVATPAAGPFRSGAAEDDNGQVTPLAALDWRVRYAITAAILLVIAAVFVQREFVGDDRTSAAVSGGASGLGLLDAAPETVGARAPDFVLQTTDGKTVRLSDFRGKTVVLNFWASWCTPCRREMADFEEMYRARLGTDDFVVLAVDYRPLDSESEVRRFLRDFEEREGQAIGFPVLYDTADGAVAERYGVAPRNARQATLPVSFFIDRDGVLRHKVFGPVFGDLLPQTVAATEAAAGG